jgi:transposase
MAKELVSVQLWQIVEPLLPPDPRRWQRPRLEDRAALTGIVFVLKSGIPWQMLPQERWAAESGVTCCWSDDCASGKRRACGNVSWACLWTVSEKPSG